MGEVDWQSGQGLLSVDDPKVVDDVFGRDEKHVGIAVIGLTLNHDDLDVVAPRIVSAIESARTETRRLGFTAAGHSVRLFQRLDDRIERALFHFRNESMAATALDDATQYESFWRLPWWLKKRTFLKRLRWHLLERWR